MERFTYYTSYKKIIKNNIASLAKKQNYQQQVSVSKTCNESYDNQNVEIRLFTATFKHRFVTSGKVRSQECGFAF